MGTEYTGAGGARHFYGPRPSPATKPDPATSKEKVYGNVVELEVNFTYDNLPTKGNAGADAVVLSIPANSLIKEARAYIAEAFNSATPLSTVVDIGLQTAAGVEIDNDGLFNDVGGLANGTTTGWFTGAGALVGASTGANAGYITVTPSANNLTAGRVRLLVSYIPVAG